MLPAGSGSEAFREARQQYPSNVPPPTSCLLQPAPTTYYYLLQAWATQLLPAVRDFEPEAIFLSTGFDAHAQEEVAFPLAPHTSPPLPSLSPLAFAPHPYPLSLTLAPRQVASPALRDDDLTYYGYAYYDYLYYDYT